LEFLFVWPWSCLGLNTRDFSLRAPGLSLVLDTYGLGLGLGPGLGAYGLLLALSLGTVGLGVALALGNLVLVTSLVITTLKLHDVMSFHLL